MTGQRILTETADHPVKIAGLPEILSAYPVYRISMHNGQERRRTLLRLEIRAANPALAACWNDSLQALDVPTRKWLLKQQSGRAAVISRRYRTKTIELLYRWCESGIVTFEVQPPPMPGAEHGPLVAWRVTPEVASHADDLARRADEALESLHRRAEGLAAKLAGDPSAWPLAQALARPNDVVSLEHVVAVAQALVDDPSGRGLRPPNGNTGLTAVDRVIRHLARGSFKDYTLDPLPIARAGQATVTGAVHKQTGARVAYKRVRFRHEDSIARMRREIEAGRLFGDDPHVMPLLDASQDYDWFIMPLAAGTAETLAHELRDPAQLRRLVIAICTGLRRPHQQNWIHRDLKPENILKLRERWTVADWGLGRRPRGQTSDPDRTRAGTLYGTEGFAAPELSVNAHEVGPQADIFSIGQIIGSILTGTRPHANVPLLPSADPWRSIVMVATHADPAMRPPTVDDLLALLAAVA